MDSRKIPILAIDKRDGSVVRRFASVREAAEWAEVSQHTIRESANSLAMTQGRYIYRRELDWHGSEVFRARANGRPVVVMGRGHLCWFPTLTDASAALEVPMNTVSQAIKNKGKVNGEWQVAYLTSTEDWPRLREKFDVRRNR